MLANCKEGDWIIFKVPKSNEHHIGVVLEEPKVDSIWYKLQFHVTVNETTNIYTKAEEHLQGYWNSDNRFVLPYKPTIEEIFKIKQTQEKE